MRKILLPAICFCVFCLIAEKSTSQNITTVAGNGTAGYNGDNILAINAELNAPVGVAFDAFGNLYVADYQNARIRKINVGTNIISTVAGNGSALGYNGDNIPAVTAGLTSVFGVAIDVSGNLFLTELNGHRIRKVDVTTGLISTIAGNGIAGYNGDNILATSAELTGPANIVIDANGNIFFVDAGNSGRIRKIDAGTGIITTIAGSGTAGFNGDNIPATSAQLNAPDGLALDGFGNIFISDAGNQRIRKITAGTGIITTIAGNGIYGYNGDNISATSAELADPSGLSTDAAGNVYISDQLNQRIRKVTVSTGLITTVAGTGTAGFNGDNIPAISAKINYPAGIVLDLSGNIWFADYANNRIREVSVNLPPTISNFTYQTVCAGIATGVLAFTIGDDQTPVNNLVLTGSSDNIALVPNSNIVFSGSGANQTVTVTPVSGQSGTATITITVTDGGGLSSSSTFLLTANPLPTVQPISGSSSVSVGQTTSLSDASMGGTWSSDNITIASVDVNGLVTGVAPGTVNLKYTIVGTNGCNNTASIPIIVSLAVSNGPSPLIITLDGNTDLSRPSGEAVDASGNLFFADLQYHRVRKIAAGTGIITTVAGNGSPGYNGDYILAISAKLYYPNGVAVDASGNLYIADQGNERLRRVDAVTGIITTIAGDGTPTDNGDNIPAVGAELDPFAVAVDKSGNLFIDDQGNQKIRRIDAVTGIITTVAGNGSFGYNGDNIPALSSDLYYPTGIAVDGSGNLFIADYYENRIRKVDAVTGMISTVVGNGTAGYNGDNIPAVSAELNAPSEVMVDASGNLYISDQANNRIRAVAAGTGIITTVAGTGVAGYNGDNISATTAELNSPDAIAVDAFGNLFISDETNSRIREVLVSPPPTINSFSPASGPVGTLVTINGANLTNQTSISIGGVPVIQISNSGTQIVTMVMPGAMTGTVTVGTASASSNFTLTSVLPPNTQQGNKLVGSNIVGLGAEQGYSIAISADGNTAVVGGFADNNSLGAAWVFSRSNGIWSQQGNKLVGTGAIGNDDQGYSVSISADGNTVLVGGVSDNGEVGAAWVFIRSNGTWAQQGIKLVGSGSIGSSAQGSSASLSADGNTAIVGGFGDNNGIGASWIFIRNNGVWTQQGAKLVGSGSLGKSNQGHSVSLSADGNTAIIGGYNDNNGQPGASWIFTRNNGLWSQQGGKLIGTGDLITSAQGSSVSLSADGNTAVIGGYNNNTAIGATWVFVRSNGVWLQQGPSLIGSGAIGAAEQGISVSLSADGNTVIVGGSNDDNSQGAAWVFSRNNGIWSQYGNKLVGIGSVGNSLQGQSVSISADGHTAIIGGIYDNLTSGAAWVFTGIPPLNVLQTSSDQMVCLNTTATPLLVTVTGYDNSTTLTYQWYSNTVSSNSNGTIITGATSASYAPPTSAAGTTYYYCVVTSSIGATGTSNISGAVIVTAGAFAGSISGATTVCAGTNSTILTLTGYTGNIQWQSSLDNISFTNIPGEISATYTAVNLNATNYYQAVVTNGTCVSTSSSVTMNVNPAAVAGYISGTTILCAGQTTTLTDATTGGTWSVDNGSVATIDVNGILAGVSGGTANVTYTVVNSNNCSASATIPVIVNALPIPAPISGATNVCTGLTVSLSDAVAGGTWSVDNTAVATIDANGNVTGVTAGTANIRYTLINASGCSATVSTPVTVNDPPLVSPITGNTNICIGSTAPLNDITFGGVWSIDNLSVATVDANGVVTGLSAGTANASYTVTNANGCSKTVTTVININSLPVVPAITGTASVCIGLTTQLNDSYSGGMWSVDNPSIATINISGIVTGVLAGTANASYTVINAIGCSATASIPVTVNGPPVIAPIVGNTNVCIGSIVTLSDVTAGGLWSSSNNAVATINSSGVVTVLSAGSTTIQYTVSNNGGCTGSTSVIIVVSPPVTVSPITGTKQICQGSSVILADKTPGGSWLSSNPSIASVDASGSVTGISTGAATITYSVASGSCMSSVSAVVTVKAAPVVAAISGPSMIILGGSITLSDPTPGGVWSITAPSNATITQAGLVTSVSSGKSTVSYKVSNTNGCTVGATTVITVYNPLTIAVTATDILCNNATTTIKTKITGGSASYSYSVNGGSAQSTGTFTEGAGTYTVQAQDLIDGQIITAGITLSQPAALGLVLISETNATGTTANGSFTVSGSGGVSPYKYSNSGGAYTTSATFSKLKAGTYNVSIKDANSCTAMNAVTVVISNGITKSGIVGSEVFNATSTEETVEPDPNLFEAKISPNPSESEFVLQIRSGIKQTVEIRVLDVSGRMVYRTSGDAANTYRFGQTLLGGVYFVQIIHKNGIKVLKIIKG